LRMKEGEEGKERKKERMDKESDEIELKMWC
jgi:hypothetical protein